MVGEGAEVRVLIAIRLLSGLVPAGIDAWVASPHHSSVVGSI